MRIGNGLINGNPCDDTAQRQNWLTLAPLVNAQLLGSQSGNPSTGWVRFQLTSAFTSQLATANIYDDTWTDTGESITVFDIRNAYSGATGSEKGLALLFGTNPIVYEVEILDFSTGGGGGPGTDELVKATATDSTAGYLHAKINDVAAYASGADLLVKAETQGGAGVNQKERFSVDVSAIGGWTGSGKIFLGADDGTSGYFAFSDLITYILADATFITTITAAVEKYRLVRCFAKGAVATGSGSNPFVADGVEAIASGLDPSDNDPDFELTVYKWRDVDSYADNEELIAFYDETLDRWRAIPKARDGTDGASGTFVCVLSGDIASSTPGSTMTSGTGTVYSVGSGGALSSLGTRTIYNPFTCEMPASSAQYACAKTYDDATDSDDEFTIIGPDVIRVLYNLMGAGEKTVLSLPAGASGADDIQWLGGEC